MDFTGKTAVATGAASGMGLLFAQNFAALGGNVVMCDVNEAAQQEEAAKSSYRRGGLAPRCRLVTSWGWRRSQGLRCTS